MTLYDASAPDKAADGSENPCMGLLVEGGATNLIASAELVSREFVKAYPESWKLLYSSDLGDGPCWQVVIPPGGLIDIAIPISFESGTPALTSSCFCWSSPEGATLVIAIEVPGNSVQRTFRTVEPRQRVKVSLPIPQTSCQALTRYSISNPTLSECTAHLAFPCVERGAFASSPVPPGGYRSPELLDLNDSHVFFDASGIGAVFLTFFPLLDYHEWNAENDGCIFGAYSADGESGIELFIGASSGKLGLAVTEKFLRKRIESHVRPAKDTICGVAALWDGSRVELVVDGNLIAYENEANVEFTKIVKTRIGNHPLDDRCPSNIVVRSLRGFNVKVAPWEIHAVFAELEPERYWYFTPILDRLLESNASHFPRDLVCTLLKVPGRWQSLPPVWAVKDSADEGIFRDDVANMLEMVGFIASPEVKCADGRTDLLVVCDQAQRVRIEFKIWGRHDYAIVPLKPIKYMTDDESCGIVVMLNNSKSSIDRKYVHNVLVGPTNCRLHVELPFSDGSGPFHFTSEHEVSGRRVHILHIVFNLKKPAARASLIQQIEANA